VSSILIRAVVAMAVASSLLAPSSGRAAGKAGGLTGIQHELLSNSKYVYIASTRKDGTLGKPAEIWFLFHDDAVWVGTRPASWRAKRIRAGRPEAQIAIGKVDGVGFSATGEVVSDPDVAALMMRSFALKYPDRWPDHAAGFRSGFADGSRILIRYAPHR